MNYSYITVYNKVTQLLEGHCSNCFNINFQINCNDKKLIIIILSTILTNIVRSCIILISYKALHDNLD